MTAGSIQPPAELPPDILAILGEIDTKDPALGLMVLNLLAWLATIYPEMSVVEIRRLFTAGMPYSHHLQETTR